jgi:hypothetical protein
MEVLVRQYEAGDADALSQVMWRSVREAAPADYSYEMKKPLDPGEPR